MPCQRDIVAIRLIAAGTLLCAICGQAAAQRYVDSSGTIRNYTTGGVSGGGFYGLLAMAFDSVANPTTDLHEFTRLYKEPPFGDFTDPVSRNGNAFRSKALAAIETFARLAPDGTNLADGWNSNFSSAQVIRRGPAAGAESASAQSRVADPNHYTVANGETSVTFSLIFSAGTHLDAAFGGAGEMSWASITGNQGTDLLDAYLPEGGSLFNYAWSANSLNPSASTFTFSSNPALGLDDVGIASAFLANLTSVDGEFTLINDFMIQGVVDAEEGMNYEFGGLTDYNAAASVVPAPGCIAAIFIGAAAGMHRRRR